jgi:hypothetical protein
MDGIGLIVKRRLYNSYLIDKLKYIIIINK